MFREECLPPLDFSEVADDEVTDGDLADDSSLPSFDVDDDGGGDDSTPDDFE